jgi:hypothetical protein
MKPVTIDMLRAHLMAASLTAMAAEVLLGLALLVSPVSEPVFTSTRFRMLATAAIVGGVVVIRQFARIAFAMAVRSSHATPGVCIAGPVWVAADCPWRSLVILHLRFTGKPFVLDSQ